MTRSLGTLGLPAHRPPTGGADLDPACAWCGRGDCVGSLHTLGADQHFCCNTCEQQGAYRTPPEVTVARETEVPGPRIPMKAIRQPTKKGAADMLAGLAEIGRKPQP